MLLGETMRRHDFIERSVANAQKELGDPSVRNYIGSKALEFETMLSSAVIADTTDGLISLPDDYDYDTCPLPIGLFSEDEILRLSSDFNSQTTDQSVQTMQTFAQWNTKTGTPESVYRRHALNSSVVENTVVFSPNTLAMTGVNADILTPAKQAEYFSQPPLNGFGLVFIRNRPIVMLRYQPGKRYAAPDAIVHELSHVRQATKNPIITARSQRSITMQMLRQELEAYHDGFPISQKVINHGTPAHEGNIHSYIQYNVEGIRLLQPLLDPTDPYKPTGLLWRAYQEKGLGNILHLLIDYDAIVANLKNYK